MANENDFYEIVDAENNELEDWNDEVFPHVPDPISVKGSGHITVFGLSNRFDSEFPQQLTGRIAPEEFANTIGRINKILHKFVSLNFFWLVLGCLCCCCTVGCSIWPVLCLNKRSKRMLEKALDWENRNLYHKQPTLNSTPLTSCSFFYRQLGLHWKLSKQRLTNSTMLQHVLLIEFIPKVPVYKPD